MSSYSEWISARGEEYAEAITEAYDNRDGVAVEGNYAWAWQQLLGDSEVNSFLPPSSNAFWTSGGGPTADEDSILAVGKFLTDNPTVASALNLAVQVIVDTQAQTDLNTSNIVGGDYRQWKGQKVYTFPNGIVVGKNSKLIASLGAEVNSLGDDTLIFFDGIPGSKGTTTAGTAVFNGDMVVSGSIQGAGGIVIIDDVIQLEQGVNNPAGIAVNDEGKILLRHRGLGFLDFIDEDERMKGEAIDEGKLWVGTQNTNSSRWGSTLIPNGNFSLVTAVSENGNVVEYPSGVVTIGSSSREVSFLTNGDVVDYGVMSFDASGGTGFIMPAVPIESERYVITIRIASSVTNIDASALDPQFGAAYGAYFFFNETSDEDLDGVEHIHHLNSTITGTNSIDSNVSVHTANTQENRINVDDTSPDPGLGSSLNTTWDTLTFTYTPTKIQDGFQTKYASFGVYIKNVSENVYLDYVVMTAKPPLASEIADDISKVETGLTNETGSMVPDAAFPSIDLWKDFPIGTGAIELLAEGGDSQPATPDSACRVNFASLDSDGFNGLLSHAIQRDHDKYLVGARIKTSASCDIEITIVEETSGQFNAFSSTWYISPTVSPVNTVDIQTVAGVGPLDPDDASLNYTHTLNSEEWTNLFGTYIPTGLDLTGHDSSSPPTSSVGRFSVFINVKTAGVNVDIDYVWCSKQTASGDLAEALADYAFGSAQAFVTGINDALTKESGSLISNASMALPSSNLDANGKNLPAGYVASGATLTAVEVGDPVTDRALEVTSNSGYQYVYSPPFQIGEADKFSIGVRALSNSASWITVAVVWSDEDLSDGELTVADSSNLPSDTSLVLSSTNVESLDIDPDGLEGGSTTNLQLSSGDYENVLATWDKPDTAKVGSIMIGTNGSIVVDYILVKEQTCSFELAEQTAKDKRDEAIAQATGALQGLTNSLNQEQGSLLANSTFASYVYDSSSDIQKPKNWAVTRSNGTFERVVSSTEAADDTDGQPIPVPGENVQSLGLLGGGAILTHTGTSTIGLLSSYFSLPSTVGVGDIEVDSETVSPTGRYMIAVQYRSLNSSHTSGLRILAHESKTIPTSPFILVTSSTKTAFDSGTTVASSYSTSYTGDTLTEDDSTVQTQKVQLITLSDDSDDTVGEGGDEYIEEWTNTGFHSVGGTYTPSSGMRYVCFEFIFETNKSSQEHAIDYITLTPQTVDADFADTLAIARAEDLIDNLEEEPPQRGNLIENPFFTSAIKRTRKSKNYPKKWIPIASDTAEYGQIQFANTVLNRGITILGKVGDDYKDIPGVVSSPFRTAAADYEITIRIKRNDPDDDNIHFAVFAEEYDSDIEDDIVAITYNPSVRTPSSIYDKVQHGVGLCLTSAGGNNLVERTDGTAIARTRHSNFIDLTHDNYETYKIQYVPSDTTRYASIAIVGRSENIAGFSLAMVKCVVDTGATYTRKLGPWFGKGLLDIDLNSFLDGDDIRGRVGENDKKTSYEDTLVLSYLEGLDATSKDQGLFGLISANTAKEGWAGQVTQYDDALARAAAGGMGLLDFTNFGNRVDGVTKRRHVNPFKDYCYNGDFKIMTETDAYITQDAAQQRGVYPSGVFFGSTNAWNYPNDADGEDGGDTSETYKQTGYPGSNANAKYCNRHTGGYSWWWDNGNDISDLPDWYWPKLHMDSDGNYIQLAPFGAGIIFSAQKVMGGSRLKLKFEAKRVKSKGALKSRFWWGYNQDGLHVSQHRWMQTFDEIENVLAVGILGRSAEADHDFLVINDTEGNGACPSNRDATILEIDNATSDYILQKSVHITSDSWETYSVTFDTPDDLEVLSVFIGRKNNFTDAEWTDVYTGWAEDSTPLGYSGDGGLKNNGDRDLSTTHQKHWSFDSWQDAYNEGYMDEPNNGKSIYSGTYDYVAGWDISALNSGLTAMGSVLQWELYSDTANATGYDVNLDADNRIYLRNVSCKEVSGLTLNAMVLLKNVSSYTTSGFRFLIDSDEKFKTEIEPAKDALESIMEIPVSKFKWNPKNEEDLDKLDQFPKSWGIIAQDLAKTQEQMIGKSKRVDGIRLRVSPDELISMSVKAIQEQQALIESQQGEINELKKLVQQLINKNNDSDESPEE